MDKRTVFLSAAAALLALGLGPVMTASAAPDQPAAAGVSDAAISAAINTVGDDLFSATDLSSVLDPTRASPTQHYGPYASGSPDSGTCGNNWAEDTFDRHFTVQTNTVTGAVTVVEQFKDGSFVTNAGLSPGGCETNVGGTVNAGVTGSMHGYFIISNVGSQTSTSPYCDATNNTNSGCTTATFVNTHFAPCYPVTCTVTTYFDHYVAPSQGLLFNQWKNASADRGGDDGDIANT